MDFFLLFFCNVYTSNIHRLIHGFYGFSCDIPVGYGVCILYPLEFSTSLFLILSFIRIISKCFVKLFTTIALTSYTNTPHFTPKIHSIVFILSFIFEYFHHTSESISVLITNPTLQNLHSRNYMVVPAC